MSASTERTEERLPLRLRLNETMGDGTQDGTWWPQTRDLHLELPDLVDNFPRHYGLVNSIVFALPDWDTAPRHVRVHRGQIKVGPYSHHRTHQVLLSMSTRREIALIVTPPDPPPEDEVGAQERSTSGPDIEAANPDAILLWTDGGESWWGAQAVAPSDRE
jgi:hypothetical protein